MLLSTIRVPLRSIFSGDVSRQWLREQLADEKRLRLYQSDPLDQIVQIRIDDPPEKIIGKSCIPFFAEKRVGETRVRPDQCSPDSWIRVSRAVSMIHAS